MFRPAPSVRRLAVRAADLVLSTDRHTRIRVQQWALSGVVMQWQAFNLLGLALIYAALRSRASQRCQDPSLTQLQMLFGLANVMWCYAISMHARGATLYPLMLIFAFGAFQLRWKHIAGLTVVALGGVAVTMVLVHRVMPDRLDPMVDWANFLMVSIVLAGTAAVAARLGRLRVRLRRHRGQLEEALARIQEMASRDTLTGLFNRGHAEQTLVSEFERTQRGGQPLSVALIDLDHFKSINDRRGHAAGDAVLKAMAGLARSELRCIDLVARWGGEEFLVVLPNTTSDAALLGLQRLLEAVQRCRVALPGLPTDRSDASVGFSFSAGISAMLPGDSVDALLARADAALYRAKASGRSRIVVDDAGGASPLSLPSGGWSATPARATAADCSTGDAAPEANDPVLT
jgi:diguanylate cyclase (GGDEF)-like protein